MTAQIRDNLTNNGQKYSIASEPLGGYLQAMDIEFQWCSTGCYRGYVASWEVSDDKLFLIEVEIPGFTPEFDRVHDLFPGQEKTFADWYTGRIRIPHGELLEYVHQGYGSIYEKELYLRFLNGKLMGKSEKDNRLEYEEKLAREKRYEKERENKKLKNRIQRLFKN